MATVNIGTCITPRIASEHLAKVLVPAGGLFAGQVVNVKTLNTTIPNNFEVYTATVPATASLTDNTFALVVNGGFETLSDGRRPAGQPDFTAAGYGYVAGDIADVVFLDRHLTFLVGTGDVTGGTASTPADDIGKYLIPANGVNTFAVSSSAPTGGGMLIVAVYNVPLGGQFGGQFATAYVGIGQ